MTLGVSLFAVAVGAALGLVFALMKKSDNGPLRIISKIYIEVIRGTPMIVQALIMAFGIPILLKQWGISFTWPDLIIPAMLVCGLNSAAYMAEVIRGGIQAVDPGQVEAAQSLGMSKHQITRLIVLPQAIRIVIPSFGNEFISLIKGDGSAVLCGRGGDTEGSPAVGSLVRSDFSCLYRSCHRLSDAHIPPFQGRGGFRKTSGQGYGMKEVE